MSTTTEDTDAIPVKDRFPDFAAKAALAGWQLWRSDPNDGHQRFFMARLGQVRVLPDLAEVDFWLTSVTGKGAAE